MTALTSHYSRPIIRAHLPKPLYVRRFHSPLPSPRTAIERFTPMRHALRNANPAQIILALVLLVLCFGLTLGAMSLVPGAAHPVSASNVAEDDPAFDCLHHGNRYCGDPERAHVMDAWGAWDDTDGWTRLRVPADRTFSVDYVGWGVESPKLGEMEAAAPGKDGKWYVFRATFTD